MPEETKMAVVDKTIYYEDEADVKARKREKKRVEILRRIATEIVPLTINNVLIKGNTNTKIESLIEGLKKATSVQDFLQTAKIIRQNLQKLDLLVDIKLVPGPPGTSDVVVQLIPLTKTQARSWPLEGLLKLKNLFAYGDRCDGSLSYGWVQTSEVSAGISLPRDKKWFVAPVMAQISLLPQDWLKFSSYNKYSLGVSIGLLSLGNNDLSINLSRCTSTEPSQKSSQTVRRQLEHSLLPSVKYTYKLDRRNSPLRPTSGYAFVFTSQAVDLYPDSLSFRYVRPEFDLRYAFPLGFYNAAINFGIAGGTIYPWGKGFMNSPSSLPGRFFLGGNSSPVCSLGGPTSVWRFRSRGLGPTELGREVQGDPNFESPKISEERNNLGGDLAVTGFADLSFDLPLKVLRDAGIHGHAFVCAATLTKINVSAFQNYRDTFQASVGVGIIAPTKLFRMEVNYRHILRQGENGKGKSGIQFSFSSKGST